MTAVVGIDLGTTNSCVAIYKNNSVKIVETKNGQKTLPSHVFYSKDKELIVGDDAVSRAALDPKKGIYDSKRIIGRQFDDDYIQKNLDLWLFDIRQGKDNECEIILPVDGGDLKIKAEEVSAAILRELKENVEKYLNEKIVNIVLTVPAYFTDAQRRATKDAAQIAGLNVLRLIPEPTAAALAFLHNEGIKKPKTILVYDLGGGTFDVSLLKYYNGKAKVLAVAGDHNLGGRDFDRRLFHHMIQEIKSQGASLEGVNTRRIKRRIEKRCEDVKISLSSVDIFDLELYDLGRKDIRMEISRQTFEYINRDLFAKTISIIDNMLSEINCNKNKIDEILMVGGSTRIPKIKQLVKECFNGKELNTIINPDEAVAIGAAIQAAQMSKNSSQRCKNYQLNDVTPHSLGIEVIAQDSMNVLIKKNTQIPFKTEKDYYTHYDFQQGTTIRIFEGESRNVGENNLLGEFIIDGITPKPRGTVKIRVEFSLDGDGILKVTATENTKNLSKNLSITLSNGRMSNMDIGKAHLRMLQFSSVRVDD